MIAKARLFVISGPSGSGKSRLISDVLKDMGNFEKSVSATTRPKRSGEIQGKQYYFVPPDEFRDMIDRESLLEWAVYAGYYYGTPESFVREKLSAGINVILEIEVQGAMQVMEKIDSAYFIFITTTIPGELKERLIKRATESREEIEKRLKIAEKELKYKKYYDCIIVNNNYNEALKNLKSVLIEVAGKANK
jgi:guanylate kinase